MDRCPADRGRINQLKAHLLTDRPASVSVISSHVEPRAQAVEALHGGIADNAYRPYLATSLKRWRGGKRIVEPQDLLLNYPVWYLLHTIQGEGRDSIITSMRLRLRA